jgi:hypothetical protein
MYNPGSKKAEEFIDHEEILETLQYAEQNKKNEELITALIEKAKLRKGLSHREASVLLACELEEKNEEIYQLAEQIKKDFYGNRIVMFAPLYLSNYCVNGCVYCPYHLKNKHIARKKLTQEEVAKEVIALQDMGHKRLAIEAGEDPVNNPIEYILECIDTIYRIAKFYNITVDKLISYRFTRQFEDSRTYGSLYRGISDEGITIPLTAEQAKMVNELLSLTPDELETYQKLVSFIKIKNSAR